MTPEQRAVFRRLCNATTQGYWERYGPVGSSGLSRVRVQVGELYTDIPYTPEDAAFIVYARTALLAALDALDAADRRKAEPVPNVEDYVRLQAIVANLCAELEGLPDLRLKLLAKQAAEAAELGGAMRDSVTVPVPNEDCERLRSAIAHGAPYSIQQARVLGVCRICGVSQFTPPDSMVYRYGAEHAHQFCLDREAAKEKR